MTEQQLCEYVEKHNQSIECTYKKPKYYIDAEEKMVMLDELMNLHDSGHPMWVEACAKSKNGAVMWARSDAREYYDLGYRMNFSIRFAWANAYMRARELASVR